MRSTRPAACSWIVLGTVLIVLVAACGGPAAADSEKVRAQAQTVFESLCVTCHGTVGKGDGPGSKDLNPKPRAFADVAWQDSITDEQIIKTVTLGGAAVGKSAQMPAQPQLKGQTALLKGLVAIVRGFRGRQ